MIAMTAAEKQKAYRLRKAAAEFEVRTELSRYPTVEEFIEAKLNDDSEDYYHVHPEQLDTAFSRLFYEVLENYIHDWASDYLDSDEYEEDYEVYSTENLLAAWKEAEERYNEQ